MSDFEKRVLDTLLVNVDELVGRTIKYARIDDYCEYLYLEFEGGRIAIVDAGGDEYHGSDMAMGREVSSKHYNSLILMGVMTKEEVLAKEKAASDHTLKLHVAREKSILATLKARYPEEA